MKPSAHFVDFSKVEAMLRNRTVAVVGSSPSVLANRPGFVDGHEVVVRVNNYKLGSQQGFRTDAHYSFYGRSIKKTFGELRADGVKMCICKCPNSKPLESKWHRTNGYEIGTDFRYIYSMRQSFWFCDTYVPTDDVFMEKFDLLGGHIPTTGFSALLDVLRAGPSQVTMTGFDFFASKMHNVDERWVPGDPDDPIGHRPEKEAEWVFKNCDQYNVWLDVGLQQLRKQWEKGRAAE